MMKVIKDLYKSDLPPENIFVFLCEVTLKFRHIRASITTDHSQLKVRFKKQN